MTMTYNAKILKDSITLSGDRLITLEVTFPRIVLAEFNTHRVFSRNSASSRAIPIEKMIKKVESDPFVPTYWGKNQKGMQAEEPIEANLAELATKSWLESRDYAVLSAKKLNDLGVHKQLVNRLLEPFLWHTVIVTASEWDNFLALRCHKDAQPEIRTVAELIRNEISSSIPITLIDDNWHLPLVDDYDNLAKEGFNQDQINRICAGRCARVSYLTHLGTRDPKADLDLANKLQEHGHMSPFEHVARPMTSCERASSRFSKNFKGWVQFRRDLLNEAIFQEKLAT